MLNIFSRANLNRNKEKIDTNTVMEGTLLFFWVKVNNLKQLYLELLHFLMTNKKKKKNIRVDEKIISPTNS